MRQLIPADTVDAAGNVWETTGENIRNGEKTFSENDVKSIVDILFPIGSIYCGENSFILSVGKWNKITANAGAPIALGSESVTGATVTFAIGGATITNQTALRMWKRVS